MPVDANRFLFVFFNHQNKKGETMDTTPISQLGGQTPPQLSTEQKVLASVDLVSQTASSVASAFGHTNVGNAIAEYSSLAPVFAGLFDTIRGLFAHHKAVASN
jgi:hypothetical protein